MNGILITYGRINAVIVTLGTMAIFRGIAFILSDGQSISIFDNTFRWIGVGRVLGLPVPIWILIVVAIALLGIPASLDPRGVTCMPSAEILSSRACPG